MKRAQATGPTAPKPAEVFTLHRYFISADVMRYAFELKLKTEGVSGDLRPDTRALMDYWYAGLYILIEGWQELKLSDPAIDALLCSPNVGLLKRYRNGVCHFQRRYFDDRFMDLIYEKSTVAWIRALHSEFSKFFLEFIRTHEPTDMIPPELKAQNDSQD